MLRELVLMNSLQVLAMPPVVALLSLAQLPQVLLPPVLPCQLELMTRQRTTRLQQQPS